MFIRFFSGLLALLLAGHAWAQTCTVYIATAGGFTGSPKSSAAAAVSDAVAKFKAGVSVPASGSGEGVKCGFRGYYSSGTEYGSEHGWVMVESQSRLRNSTTNLPYCSDEWSGGGRSGVGVQKKENADCPDTCSARSGEDTVINWTVGYTRTPNIDTDPSWFLVGAANKLPSDGVICDPTSTCQVAATFAGSDAYQSRYPTSQGLYRVSLDLPSQHLGKACIPSATENAGANPKAPEPTCPGSIGEVNGVVGCYGTAAAPTRNDVAEPKPAPPSGGNPAAGEKPTSGEGSGNDGPGRTPSTGTGGPSGGPAGAVGGTGTKPDGTTTKPGEGKEQANCGAPGQPKCGIDETGTPGKYEGNGAALDKWKAEMDTNRGTIKDSGGGVFDSFNVFFSAPPIAACEPIELPNEQSITRHCDVVSGTRAVMSYIWALSALWLCVGWIREAI